MSTICPRRRATIPGARRRVRAMGARRFTSSARSISSSVKSRSGPLAGSPALATKTSTVAGLVGEAGHVLPPGQVRDDHPRADLVRDAAERVGPPPAHHDARARGAERPGDGLPDAAVRAGHERGGRRVDVHGGRLEPGGAGVASLRLSA